MKPEIEVMHKTHEIANTLRDQVEELSKQLEKCNKLSPLYIESIKNRYSEMVIQAMTVANTLTYETKKKKI